MMKRMLPVILILAILVSMSVSLCAAPKPRLIVLISIDQFREDYLTRFEDLYLPPGGNGHVGGFRWLMERGAYYPDAHHDHFPLATGPGHSVFFTGAPPYKSGIVGNDWFDYAANRSTYCVRDDASPLVGAENGNGISAANLRVTTVGDEMKMASGGQSKVFGISLKDRAAVLMAGHLADGVFWFDESSGKWISSRAYRKDGTLPGWLDAVNSQKIPQSYFQKTWNLSVPTEALKRLWRTTDQYVDAPKSLGDHFPHVIGTGQTEAGSASNKAFATSPFANGYVLDTAKRLVMEEQLGRDDIPDVLAVNLASNDYIGHAFGPDSPEVLDTSVQTDRQLSQFFNEIISQVPGGQEGVTFIVTADHGVAPVPAVALAGGLRAGIWSADDVVKTANAALDAAFGNDDWAKAYVEPYLWLNRGVIAKHNIAASKVEDVAAEAISKIDGVYAAYPRHRILSGELPRTDIAHHVTLGFHPQVSGDIVVISAPFYMLRSSMMGTTHGEPYAYDTHVPLLLAGCGVKPGTYTDRVSTLDVAPTLSFLLHVQEPSGCEGRILSDCVQPTKIR